MWTYNFTDYDNNFLAHTGRKGMKWGKHLFGDIQEKVQQKVAESQGTTTTTVSTTSSGRKRNVSGEATGSVEKRGEGLGTGSVNPNGAYNRTASNTASTSSSGSKEKTAFQKWNERFDMAQKHKDATRSNESNLKIDTDNAKPVEDTSVRSSGRKRNVSGEATGSVEKRGEGLGTGSVNPNGTYNKSGVASTSSREAAQRVSDGLKSFVSNLFGFGKKKQG